MTAYDIIAELNLEPSEYFRCEVLRRYLGGTTDPRDANTIVFEVRPLRFADDGQTFEVPREGAKELMRELNAIFESARKLTA